jgi:hypothetical protein
MNEEIKERIKYILDLLGVSDTNQASFFLGELAIILEQLPREEKTAVKVGEVLIEPLSGFEISMSNPDDIVFLRATKDYFFQFPIYHEHIGDFFREVKP